MDANELRIALIDEGFTHVYNPYGLPIPLYRWDRRNPEECRWTLVTYLEDRQTFAIRYNPDGSVRDEYQILAPTAILKQWQATYGPWPVGIDDHGEVDGQQIRILTRAAEKMGAKHGYAQLVIHDIDGRILEEEVVVI